MAKSMAQIEREMEELEARVQSLEELVQELLGLAAVATNHFGHYDAAWDKHHKELQERAEQLLDE